MIHFSHAALDKNKKFNIEIPKKYVFNFNGIVSRSTEYLMRNNFLYKNQFIVLTTKYNLYWST